MGIVNAVVYNNWRIGSRENLCNDKEYRKTEILKVTDLKYLIKEYRFS